MKCRYCGSSGKGCYPWCGCSKCVEKKKYNSWKKNNPGQYKAWVEREKRRQRR